VEIADLRVEGALIVARGPRLPAQAGDLETDCTGKLILPGLVCAHTHLAFTLGRGAPPASGAKPAVESLDKTWWRLDRALDPPTTEVSATAGAMEALLSGTTTVFDHHSSPSYIPGALDAVQRGVDAVGLRSVLCYAVSDRLGPEYAQAALEENDRFLKTASGRRRGMVGAYASVNLDAATLDAVVALAKQHGVGVHLHAAESMVDERDCQERFNKPLSQRLCEAGVAGPSSIVAHCTCFAWEDLASFLQYGTWMCHLPRANMLSGLGYAPASRFGPRTVLGSENLVPDMFAEVRAAVERAADAGVILDPLRLLAGAHKLATQTFGIPIGPLREGAAADLLILDYQPRLPLTAQTLAHHVVSGMSARDVESAMIDGCWRLWGRTPLKAKPEELASRSHAAAQTLWETMAAL
jgi:cytosine/adenosine deaminase-related metal-dependent hydrolase